MAAAGIEGPQACPKGLRHAYGIAAGVPLPTIAATLGHASITTTAVYTTARVSKPWPFAPGTSASRPPRSGSEP